MNVNIFVPHHQTTTSESTGESGDNDSGAIVIEEEKEDRQSSIPGIPALSSEDVEDDEKVKEQVADDDGELTDDDIAAAFDFADDYFDKEEPTLSASGEGESSSSSSHLFTPQPADEGLEDQTNHFNVETTPQQDTPSQQQDQMRQLEQSGDSSSYNHDTQQAQSSYYYYAAPASAEDYARDYPTTSATEGYDYQDYHYYNQTEEYEYPQEDQEGISEAAAGTDPPFNPESGNADYYGGDEYQQPAPDHAETHYPEVDESQYQQEQSNQNPDYQFTQNYGESEHAELASSSTTFPDHHPAYQQDLEESANEQNPPSSYYQNVYTGDAMSYQYPNAIEKEDSQNNHDQPESSASQHPAPVENPEGQIANNYEYPYDHENANESESRPDSTGQIYIDEDGFEHVNADMIPPSVGEQEGSGYIQVQEGDDGFGEDTPPTTSPEEQEETPRKSHFQFLSDQESMQAELQRAQEMTLRRRRQFLERMETIELDLCKISAQYGEEAMNFNLAIRDTIDRVVTRPLEAATERFVMERDGSDVRRTSIRNLERRLDNLDSRMTRHIHVTLGDAKQDELDTLQDQISQDLKPSMQIISSKSNKIEGGIVRRYEEVAGTVAYRYSQESAARHASLSLLSDKVQEFAAQEENKLDDFLDTIRSIRMQLKEEREARKAADQKILNDVVKTTAAIKRALLDSVVGSS